MVVNTAPISALVHDSPILRQAEVILFRWVDYTRRLFAPWPDRPNCGHFYGGSYWYALETTRSTLAFATAATSDAYRDDLCGQSQSETRRMAIAAIRYLGYTHDTGPADCVRASSSNPHCSGHKWGGSGDDPFKATQHGLSIYAMGIAAWLLWSDLDAETKLLVQTVLASYADHWATEEPFNGVFFDTKMEENGWTALGISTALTLFPQHDHAELWRTGMRRWLVSSLTTPLDRWDQTPVFGQPLARWVTGTTILPDLTAENHGFVHPIYMAAGLLFPGQILLINWMAGTEPEPEFFRHWDEIYTQTLAAWTSSDGLATPVQSQDWWYNQLPANAWLHCMTAVWRENPLAAALERDALYVAGKLQEGHRNGALYHPHGETCRITQFQTARDMEHGGAESIALICLLHRYRGTGAGPLTADEANRQRNGTRFYPFGGTVTYRTSDSFTCFTWRNSALAATLPRDGQWVVTVPPLSTFGTIRLANSSPTPWFDNDQVGRFATNERIVRHPKGFAATAQIPRGQDALIQDVAFLALPDGRTVYWERYSAQKNCAITEMLGGLVGVRNEHNDAIPELAPGIRNLSVDGHMIASMEGYLNGGDDQIVSCPPARTVALDDKIAWILHGSAGIRYCNCHRYPPRWKGVENFLSLNARTEPFDLQEGDHLPEFWQVTLPNCGSETAQCLAEGWRVAQNVTAGCAAALLGDLLLVNNSQFSNCTCMAKWSDCAVLNVFPGYNRLQAGCQTWSGSVAAREAFWRQAVWIISPADPAVSVDITADLTAGSRCLIQNQGSGSIDVRVFHPATGVTTTMTLPSGIAHVLGQAGSQADQNCSTCRH